MIYDDFAILISSSGRKGRLSIRASGQAGEHSAEVDSSIGGSEARRFLGDLRAATARRPKATAETPEGHDASASPRPTIEDLARLGRRLFAWLLPPDLRSLWERCRGIAERDGRGLRLRLYLNLAQRDLAWVGVVPWELLYDEASGGFLTIDGRTPVVRYLDVPQSRAPFPTERPWRVLVVASAPEGMKPLNLDTERKELLKTWGGGKEVELVFPDDATFDGIRAALRRGPIHGLHYMGHAVFDEPTGRAGLVIESAAGRAAGLWGDEIADLIKGVPSPALAVLNSCETGRTGDLGVAQPFGGAAAALMRAGVPAVVAMQLPIGNREATHFSKILYGALQDRKPVDWAVSEARLSLGKKFPARPVWAIPSLYMRVADGRLFPEDARQDDAELGPRVVVRATVEDIEDGTMETLGHDQAQGDESRSLPDTLVEATAKNVKRSTVRTVGVQTGRR